ncbi:MAG: hypothetical protein ABI233_02110, partial [Chthoniobacterales bacterium]
QRGSEGDFARGISMESCYFIPAPIAAVGNALLHWDPTKHPKTDARLYRDYSLGSSREAFQGVRLSSRIENDRWLLDHTFAIADGGAVTDLHLTADDVELIRKGIPKKGAASSQARDARANDVWGEILRRRSDSLAAGGIRAVAPYSSGDKSISPGSEFRGLLPLDPSAAKHFDRILHSRLFSPGGSAADETIGYWETTIVRGHTTLQLGVFTGRKSAGSWQLVDCVYYPTDTYFMALDCFQLWSVEGGTLVWQVGYVSAPFRSYLAGADRYIAGKQMTGETIDTINTFRASFGKR